MTVSQLQPKTKSGAHVLDETPSGTCTPDYALQDFTYYYVFAKRRHIGRVTVIADLYHVLQHTSVSKPITVPAGTSNII